MEVKKKMSDTEAEVMINIFFENKLNRRILELLDRGLEDDEIVRELLKEMK